MIDLSVYMSRFSSQSYRRACKMEELITYLACATTEKLVEGTSREGRRPAPAGVGVSEEGEEVVRAVYFSHWHHSRAVEALASWWRES